MRSKIIALTTAAALALTPLTAVAQENSSENQTRTEAQDSSDPQARSGSSYLKWLDEEVATTEDKDLNNFLKLLVDFLIGAGIMLVVGFIYGQISKFLPWQ